MLDSFILSSARRPNCCHDRVSQWRTDRRMKTKPQMSSRMWGRMAVDQLIICSQSIQSINKSRFSGSVEIAKTKRRSLRLSSLRDCWTFKV